MHNLMTKDMIWKFALAFAGATVTAYVFEEVLGGGALGWTFGGAIMGATCYPLFKTLVERRGLR
jgi:hypothetical protein